LNFENQGEGRTVLTVVQKGKLPEKKNLHGGGPFFYYDGEKKKKQTTILPSVA